MKNNTKNTNTDEIKLELIYDFSYFSNFNHYD